MLLPIRYAPSGPVIGNAEGGEATPGVGFQLRLVDAKFSAGAVSVTGTPQDVPQSGTSAILEVELPNPKPGLRYAVEAYIPARTAVNGIADVTMHVSFDTGSGYVAEPTNQANNSEIGAADSTGAGTVVFSSSLTLGSALQSPVSDSTTVLKAKVQISGGTSVDIANGAGVFLKLVETL